ncbi:hypothetical protein M3Y97_00965100 [Aphelenchoides bicaudatus]|nr:hypothetical protein M3Y97_00965100 [Aphelenchoides bicaudatus]
MSRVFKQLACLLNNPTKFFNTQKDLIKDAFQSRCSENEKNLFHSTKSLSKARKVSVENGWKFVMIVREPLERFVSGYVYTCLRGRLVGCTRYCNGCGANLTCFIERHENNLEKMIKIGKGSFGTNHLYPQSWTCNLRTEIKKYTFLRYNTNSQEFFDQQLGPFLQSRNTSTQVFSYIRQSMTSARTKHSNTNFKLAEFLENRIKSSPYLLEKFIQMYYHDYKLFNYTLPNLIA